MPHALQAITLTDHCSEDEIEAIAEHERVPPAIAAEILAILLQSFPGVCLIKLYLLDNIEAALDQQQFGKAQHLQSLYHRFDAQYPGADPAAARILH